MKSRARVISHICCRSKSVVKRDESFFVSLSMHTYSSTCVHTYTHTHKHTHTNTHTHTHTHIHTCNHSDIILQPVTNKTAPAEVRPSQHSSYCHCVLIHIILIPAAFLSPFLERPVLVSLATAENRDSHDGDVLTGRSLTVRGEGGGWLT